MSWLFSPTTQSKYTQWGAHSEKDWFFASPQITASFQSELQSAAARQCGWVCIYPLCSHVCLTVWRYIISCVYISRSEWCMSRCKSLISDRSFWGTPGSVVEEIRQKHGDVLFWIFDSSTAILFSSHHTSKTLCSAKKHMQRLGYFCRNPWKQNVRPAVHFIKI